MSEGDTLFNRRRLLLTTAGGVTAVLVSPLVGMAKGANEASRSSHARSSFDLGWRFHRGAAEGLEAVELDDSDWRLVDLPHDWSIEDLPTEASDARPRIVGPFDRKSEGGTATGFSVGGEGWYRKRFRLDQPVPAWAEMLFEGIYMNGDVWLNGNHLAGHAYGYTPWVVALTPHLSPTGDNVLAVRVRNLGRNSRWYSGSGIYRHVWLDVFAQPARIARWGVGVVTRRIESAGAQVEITTRLHDSTDDMRVVGRVRDQQGRTVVSSSIAAAAQVIQTVTIPTPSLWSPDVPALYTLETELRRGDALIDRMVTSFGVRIVAFDANQGMTINAVPTKLRGGCIHHDNGLLGAAAFDAAEERKVQLLKARGYNAVRPSHNPFSNAFLNACDRHGLLVIGETFDAWQEPKLPQDYSVNFGEDWHEDLVSAVLSARNHPSVIMWSIGNEIPGRNLPSGIELQWHLANEVHRLDPTRPVTAAINGFMGHLVRTSGSTVRPGIGQVTEQSSVVFLDLVGYNYKLADYEADHQRFPQRILFGTESFPKDVAAIWELTERSPWLLGDFVWTAMDYLGEAAIGGSAVVSTAAASNPMALLADWPWVNAYCGDIDLIGQQKAPSLLRDVVWGLSPLELVVERPVPDGKVEVPRAWGWHDEHRSWTWPGAEGKPLTVRVYTTGDRVELRLNGRTLANKALAAADLKRVDFAVTYEAGVLEAVAFHADAQIARKQLVTVGAPTAIRLSPEHSRGGAARSDISYVGIDIVDAQGRTVPDVIKAITLSITGPAELIALGSANPVAVGGFQSSSTQTWDGRALAIVRGTGRAGRVKIEANGEGLRIGTTSLRLSTLSSHQNRVQDSD